MPSLGVLPKRGRNLFLTPSFGHIPGEKDGPVLYYADSTATMFRGSVRRLVEAYGISWDQQGKQALGGAFDSLPLFLS